MTTFYFYFSLAKHGRHLGEESDALSRCLIDLPSEGWI